MVIPAGREIVFDGSNVTPLTSDPLLRDPGKGTRAEILDLFLAVTIVQKIYRITGILYVVNVNGNPYVVEIAHADMKGGTLTRLQSAVLQCAMLQRDYVVIPPCLAKTIAELLEREQNGVQ